MSLVIRMIPKGKRNSIKYEVVVVEKRRSPQSKSYVARVGWYDPKSGDYKLDLEEIKSWIGKGAKPSESVNHLIVKLEKSTVA